MQIIYGWSQELDLDAIINEVKDVIQDIVGEQIECNEVGWDEIPNDTKRMIYGKIGSALLDIACSNEEDL